MEHQMKLNIIIAAILLCCAVGFAALAESDHSQYLPPTDLDSLAAWVETAESLVLIDGILYEQAAQSKEPHNGGVAK